jgi:hypothetical protein
MSSNHRGRQRIAVQALWLIGPTAMFIASVITVSVVGYLDFMTFDDKHFEDLLLDLQERPVPH